MNSRALNRYILCLGSNYSDGRKRLSDALKWLEIEFSNVISSDIYTTEAYGGSGGIYQNAVAEIHSFISVGELESLLKKYERSQGRDEKCRKDGLVPIDIDIVISGKKIIRERDFSRNYFQIGYNRLLLHQQ